MNNAKHKAKRHAIPSDPCHVEGIGPAPEDTEFRGLLVVPIGQDESRDEAIRIAWMAKPKKRIKKR